MKKKFCKILSLCFFMLVVVQVQAGYCKSLSINEAVNMALQNNLDIKIAGKKEVQAQAELAGIKAQRGVTVSLKSDFSVAGGKTDGIKKEFERDDSNSISVTYPVYSGGKDSLNIAIQQQTVQQSQLNTLRTAENIKYDTLKAYYDVLEAKKTIAVDDESVNNYEKHLINVKQLYSAGSVPKSDLLRSEVELSNARQTLITAKNTYDVDVITLKNIIKMDRNEPLELTEDFKYEGFNKPLANCLSFVLDHRKDLEESKIDYIVAQKNIELAKVDYKPTVTASLSSGWNNQPLPSGNDHDYTAGVSASWNVFDNGLTKANVNAAEAEMEQAQLTLQQKNDDIDLAVRQAYLNMTEAQKRFISTKTATAQAEEDLFIAQEKYKIGSGIILDIIDAQLALSTAKLNYISAQYDYARYKAELENAMGIDAETGGSANE